MSDRPQIFVHFLPSLVPQGALQGGLAVVVDVLRATTAMTHALNSGIEAIIPCLEVDEAKAVAANLPPGKAILGGERQGLPIEGFHFGNSPSSYSPANCHGRVLVMTTTNGTKAIHAALDAERILIAAFPNCAAVTRAITAFDGPVHIICAGTNGEISLEDTLLAGALVDGDHERDRAIGNDSAEIAMSAWADIESSSAQRKTSNLADAISLGWGGRRVREIGLAADILDAAAIDLFDFVGELDREQRPFRIVRK